MNPLFPVPQGEDENEEGECESSNSSGGEMVANSSTMEVQE